MLGYGRRKERVLGRGFQWDPAERGELGRGSVDLVERLRSRGSGRESVAGKLNSVGR